jgi:hypothetical protein
MVRKTFKGTEDEPHASTSRQMTETVIRTVTAVRISDPRNYTTFTLYSFTVIMIQRNEKQYNLGLTKPQTALMPYFKIYIAILGNFLLKNIMPNVKANLKNYPTV